MLIYISRPYCTFGLIAENGIITAAPPIARWTIGKKASSVVCQYANKETIIKILN